MLQTEMKREKNIRWGDILLWTVSFILLFWGLGSRHLGGSEGRWAQVVREMFLTGDYFHPTIGFEPYFDKPLLTYWFIAAITAVTGLLNEWVVRLPSAIAGVAAVWATVRLGRRLWSDRVGSLAGWLLLTSYGVMIWSRTAAADTENLAAITLCILWYWLRRDKPNFTTFVIFYLIAFLGAQTKGLPAVIIPIVAVLPDLVVEKRWKYLFRFSHFLALAVGLAVYLVPFVYAAQTRPESYHSGGLGLVFQENIQRFFSPIDHKEPWYIYLYSVPMLMLPWAPLFVAGLIGLAAMWKHLDRNTRWLLMAVGGVFLIYSLSGSRRDYYILPITPLCALLTAVFLDRAADTRLANAYGQGMNIQKYFIFAMILAEIALPVALYLKFKNSFGSFTWLSVSGVILGLAALVVWFVIRRYDFKTFSISKEMRPLAGLIAVTVVVFGGYFCWQMNLLDQLRTEPEFIEQVNAQTADWPASRIASYPKKNATVVYYLNRNEPTTALNTDEDWKHFLEGNQPGIVLMQRKYIADVPADYAAYVQGEPDMAEEIKPWDSKSTRKDKWAAWVIKNGSVDITADKESDSTSEK